MRTTIRIDDELYRRVKARAAGSGLTVAAVIEEAVRDALRPRPAIPGPIAELPTFGGSGLMPGVDPSSNAAVLDVMDERLPLDARR